MNHSPHRDASRSMVIVFLLICFGFLSVYLAFIDRDIPAQMQHLGATYDLARYSTAPFPNLFYPLLFTALFGVAGVLVNRAAPGADPFIFPLVVFLTGIGLVMIYRLAPEIALVQNKPALRDLALRHLFWIFLGVSLMLITLYRVREHHLYRIARVKYLYVLLSMVLIVGTALFGKEIAGRKLWLPLGPFTVQTIEIVKVMLIFFIAGYFRDEGLYIHTQRRFGLAWPRLAYTGPFFLMWFLAVLPVFLQGDLGPTILLFSLFLTMFYVGSGIFSFVLIGLGSIVAGGLATYALGVPGMVRTRVDMWLNPFSAGEGMVQSFWAIASGRFWGAGLGYGLPHSIPVVQSDFNFSAVCEELGFVGGGGLVLVYALLLFRGFRSAMAAPDVYRTLLIAAIMTMFSLQGLMIICGNMELLPMTGITLPFVSYGGSAIVLNFFMLGIVLRASADNPVRK